MNIFFVHIKMKNENIGWRINKSITPEPVVGKEWRWNDSVGWKSVKSQIEDENIKP